MSPLSFYYPLAYKDSVFRYSGDFSLDPYLILAVMKAESSFQRFAVSRANARGVMQIIKPTAIFISSQLQMENFELIDLFLPDLNIKMGVWYLKFLIDKFSELVPALSAYNAGPENVSRWCSDFGDMKTFDFIESIPFSETKDYVKRVIYYYAVYKNLYSPPFEPEKIFKERACVK
jgi:soluble lytic murein transglycosylase